MMPLTEGAIWPHDLSYSSGAPSSDWFTRFHVSTENLNLLLAALTVLLAVFATAVALQTLTYMRRRDLELDTRNGWIEIHKAMVNLRVRRELVMLPAKMDVLNSSGAWNTGSLVSDYTLASAQLRGQLDRLNDDPLIVELAAFLEANIATAQWQTPQYQTEFDSFAHKVAMKSRPS